MFKSILVPTDGSEFSQIALLYGIDLAKQYQGFIKALHVVDIRAVKGPFIRDISASMGLVPIVDYQPKIQQILEERGKITLAACEKKCQEVGLRFFSQMTTGVISHEIKQCGHTVDLIVMGQRGEHAEFGNSMLGSTLEATIRETSKPVLVTPQTYKKINRILMAYDGKDVANNALRVCRNLCLELKLPLVVLNVNNDAEEANAIIAEAREYLSPYELQIEYLIKPGDASNVIMTSVIECQCDLLIMGAYGRNRLLELVLGSTTAYIIRRANFPILLSR